METTHPREVMRAANLAIGECDPECGEWSRAEDGKREDQLHQELTAGHTSLRLGITSARTRISECVEIVRTIPIEWL